MTRARNGDVLVEFHPAMELPIPAGCFPVSVTFAVTVVTHQGGVLFVYNGFRREWELPAGIIEPEETPQQAAIRELYEESGQAATPLSYAGVVLLHLAKSDTYELGCLYKGALTTLQPFVPNHETDRIMFLTPQQPCAEYVNEIGLKLASLVIDVV